MLKPTQPPFSVQVVLKIKLCLPSVVLHCASHKCSKVLLHTSTADEKSIERVTIFLSKYIFGGATDKNFHQGPYV